jgi:predicted amidohydrolase
MLRGADVLICFDRANDAFKLKTLKTRAVENRIFLIRSSANPEADNSLIINPDGAVISTTFIQDEHMSGGLIFTGLSKQKWIVPGTDVILGRHPGCYKV